ncbi:hypothetical protein C8J56DRAFT_1067981 [Mycena floridula]|nr:hypothetical protein C8J56DRAFT_1067981 [Mycena floridula]
MPAHSRPEDYNAFDCDHRGSMANYRPPTPFQIPHLPPDFIPRAPTTGYLAVAPGYALPSVPHGHYYQDPGAYSQQPAPPTSAAHLQPQTAPKKVINSFTVCLDVGDKLKEITFDTNIQWNDFLSQIAANCDIRPDTAELGYRFGKQNASCRTKPTDLNKTTFASALDQLVNTNLGARTQITIMHVIDMKRAKKEAENVVTRGKKRMRGDDVPPDAGASSDMSTSHHRNLKKDLKCETHDAAKEIAMGRATIWNPPSGHDFERKPKRAKHSASPGGVRCEEDKENAVPGNHCDLSSPSNLVGVIDKEESKEVDEENFDDDEDEDDEGDIFRERSQFVPEFE